MSVDFMDVFYYCETSPSKLRWKIDIFAGKDGRIHRIKKDQVAGSITENRYYEVTYKDKKYYCHRIVYSLFNGEIPDGFVIDHLNQNGLDNSVSNLRVTSAAHNSHNSKINSANKTGLTGVCRVKDKYWKATWSENGVSRGKVFSIEKLGECEAKQSAIEWRKKMIEELNEKGANYLQQHGSGS